MDKKLKSGLSWTVNILLSAVVGYILDKVGFIGMISPFFNNNTHRVITFFNQPIPLWEVILFLVIFSIITYVLRTKVLFKPKIVIPRQTKFYNLIDEFKDRFKYMDGSTAAIEYRTHLTMANENIVLERIEPYCKCHKIRLKMIDTTNMVDIFTVHSYTCPDEDCGNSIPLDTIRSDKNIILSILEDEWDKSIKELI